jgi:hypothetical protein
MVKSRLRDDRYFESKFDCENAVTDGKWQHPNIARAPVSAALQGDRSMVRRRIERRFDAAHRHRSAPKQRARAWSVFIQMLIPHEGY